MGCGKSKHANVAAANTVVTKKKIIENRNSTSSSISLTSSVSDKVANNHANENVVDEKKTEIEAVNVEKEVDDVVAPVVVVKKVEDVVAPVVVVKKVEDVVAVVAPVVVNDEVKGDSELLQLTEILSEPLVESVKPVVDQPEILTEIVASEPEVAEAVTSDESKATTENPQLDVTEAAEAESETAIENPQSEATEAAAEEAKTASENAQPEDQTEATTADETITASDEKQSEEAETPVAEEESK